MRDQAVMESQNTCGTGIVALTSTTYTVDGLLKTCNTSSSAVTEERRDALYQHCQLLRASVRKIAFEQMYNCESH